MTHMEQPVYLAIWKDLNKKKRKEHRKRLNNRNGEDGRAFLFFSRLPSRLRRSGRTFSKCIFSNASSIFDHFGILDHLELFQTILDHFSPSWTILDHLGPYWIILNNIGRWHNFLDILHHLLAFSDHFLTFPS